MTKDRVLGIILETKVVAVIRMSDPAKLFRVVEAVKEGGVRAIEITMTTPSALEVIRSLARNRPEGSLIGAGTVVDEGTAEAVIQAGADFVVSPVTDFRVIDICRRRDMAVMPGAFSPTEIHTAWKSGADIVKVFPATSLGPKYIKDVLAPFPGLRLMPTGGVSLENARSFVDAGACSVGIGTALLDPGAIERGEWETLSRKAGELIHSLR